MPDPQPSAAAKRLAKIAIRRMRGGATIPEISGVAIALDDAGVGRAVEALDMIYRHPEQPLKVQAWATTALASLTGDDDAK